MKRIECKTCSRCMTKARRDFYALLSPTKPLLEVIWACYGCHRKLDAAERKAS